MIYEWVLWTCYGVYAVFLVRNSSADVVSHYMSMKIYQNSTKKVCIKSKYCKLYDHKLHTENLKLNNFFHHLSNFHEDKRPVEKMPWRNIPNNSTGLLQKHYYLRTPLLKCLLLKYPLLICPPLKCSPSKSPPLKYPPLKHPPLK